MSFHYNPELYRLVDEDILGENYCCDYCMYDETWRSRVMEANMDYTAEDDLMTWTEEQVMTGRWFLRGRGCEGGVESNAERLRPL